jgi:hypothetical protein
LPSAWRVASSNATSPRWKRRGDRPALEGSEGEKGGVARLHKKFTCYFPGITRLGAVVLILPLFVIGRGSFLEAMRTEDLIPKFVAVFVGLLISLAIVSIIVAIISAATGKAIVSVTDNLLVIHRAFGAQKIRWEDIVEFGTYVTCPRSKYARRMFYVKLQSRPTSGLLCATTC